MTAIKHHSKRNTNTIRIPKLSFNQLHTSKFLIHSKQRHLITPSILYSSSTTETDTSWTETNNSISTETDNSWTEANKSITVENAQPPLSLQPEAETTIVFDGPTEEEYRQGLISIAIITVLFSSNSPVIRAAFINSSLPPPVLLLNAATSSIALIGIFLGGPLLDATVPLPCTLTTDEDESCLTTPEDVSFKAGLELGLWKMLGTTANLYGLSLTSADHGAFLIQLTTLIVPVVQGVMGIPIPKRIWTAVALALTGVFLFTDGSMAIAAATSALSGSSSSSTSTDILESVNMSTLWGDALCVLAAIFYATYDLRLFEWGNKVQPLTLIKNKISVQAGLSMALLVALGWNDSYNYLSTMLSSSGNASDLLLVGSAALWSGVAINAIAPFLQVGGQQAVGATRAQVVYASQPLWAAMLSFVLLGECLDTTGLIGGTLFLVAVFLAATAEAPDANCEEINCEV